MNLEEIKEAYKKSGDPFPKNGKQALSAMKCYIDFQALHRGMFNCEPNLDIIKQYSLARKLAEHYGIDVSSFPEKLEQETKQ